MSSKRTPALPAFTPAPSRRREDGWTPARQVDFIEALAATANVQAVRRAVGMSASSAYELRARPGAASFREAWQSGEKITTNHAPGMITDRLGNDRVS